MFLDKAGLVFHVPALFFFDAATISITRLGFSTAANCLSTTRHSKYNLLPDTQV